MIPSDDTSNVRGDESDLSRGRRLTPQAETSSKFLLIESQYIAAPVYSTI